MKKYIASLLGLSFIASIVAQNDVTIIKPSAEQSLQQHEANKMVTKPNVFTNTDDANRFKSIKIDLNQAKNEIDFWARQLSEHALFLHLGLEDASLKQRGKDLHNEFEAFRKQMTDNTMNDILPLAKKLRAYKIDVITALNDGKWIGWIYPGFAKHITLELDYFVDKLNGIPYSDQDEIAFWNMINGDHASFAAGLLDPSERELFEKADELSQKFNNLVKTEKEMMLQISLNATQELDEYAKTAQAGIKNNTIKSVIHPVLIDHVVREGERSLQILNSLQNTEGALYPQGPEEFMEEEEDIEVVPVLQVAMNDIQPMDVQPTTQVLDTPSMMYAQPMADGNNAVQKSTIEPSEMDDPSITVLTEEEALDQQGSILQPEMTDVTMSTTDPLSTSTVSETTFTNPTQDNTLVADPSTTVLTSEEQEPSDQSSSTDSDNADTNSTESNTMPLAPITPTTQFRE